MRTRHWGEYTPLHYYTTHPRCLSLVCICQFVNLKKQKIAFPTVVPLLGPVPGVATKKVPNNIVLELPSPMNVLHVLQKKRYANDECLCHKGQDEVFKCYYFVLNTIFNLFSEAEIREF